MSTTHGRPRRLQAACAVAAAALLVVAAVLLGGLGSDAFVLVVDDLAQLLAAALAAVTTGVLAHRSTGRLRRSWAALSAGCAAWALGQGVWSWYELVLGRDTPFPSIADLGFLGFALGAALALALHPAGGARSERRRRVLDGLTVTASLALISWSTALGAVVSEGADAPLTLLVSLAYPASDLVVLSMVVLLLTRATAHRGSLALVGAGIAGIAVADSAFLYLTASGTAARTTPSAWAGARASCCSPWLPSLRPTARRARTRRTSAASAPRPSCRTSPSSWPRRS